MDKNRQEEKKKREYWMTEEERERIDRYLAELAAATAKTCRQKRE
jgi:hypothetical protein